MKILHLFHDLMNLYGDYANVLALERALTGKGAETEIIHRSVGDNLYLSISARARSAVRKRRWSICAITRTHSRALLTAAR